MLTPEEIKDNKEIFINTVKEYIIRPGSDIEGLISKLENSDFFYAPATTQYFGSYAGGLCEYCLKTLNVMKTLVLDFGDDISAETLVIVSLFYNLYKMNFYQAEVRNIKVYSESGCNKDSRGRYDWSSQEYYRVKDSKDRFVYGTNGEASEFMLRYFIPLTLEESKAILNATRSTEDGQNYLPEVYSTSKLTTLLSSAIMIANYVNIDQWISTL